MNSYYDEGFKAGFESRPRSNPYLSCGCLFKSRQWDEGYTDGVLERPQDAKSEDTNGG